MTQKRILMLTPDVYYLDRRIVQEAGSLASRGCRVDIYPTNPALRTDGASLPEEVSLLANPREGRGPAGLAVKLRGLKRFLSEASPALHRMTDSLHHWAVDRCQQIVSGNLPFLISREKYDGVFAHDIPVLPLAARLKREWNCALVCDLHEIFPEMEETFTSTRARNYWRSVEKEYLPSADGIICVNEAVQDYVRERYAPKAPGIVLHNAAPYVEPAGLSGASIRELYPVPEGARVLVYVGTLIQHRNLETLVAGFERAAPEGWVLAFLGTGPLAGRLGRLIDRPGLAGKVFLGKDVRQDDVVKVAGSADAGVIPYQAVGYNHRIATPNKLFEYAQARLPILASDLPMIARLLAANGNGVCGDMSTPEAAAGTLRRFLSEESGKITPEVLERAARELSWEEEEPRLLELVDQLLPAS